LEKEKKELVRKGNDVNPPTNPIKQKQDNRTRSGALRNYSKKELMHPDEKIMEFLGEDL
jgi:hypothetical protein